MTSTEPVLSERRAEAMPARPPSELLARALPLLRLRMGFPAETFAMAVQPLVQGLVSALGEPVAARSVERAIRALDLRRDRILPAHAPPEALGALAPRWTYAVLVAGLLGELRDDGLEDAWGLFEGTVSQDVRCWLEQDGQVWDALSRHLVGPPVAANPISQIVGAAVGRGPVAANEDHTSSAEPVPVGLAGDFVRWLRSGLKDRTLVVNTSDALVHRVPDGLLLLSPGIFRVYLLGCGEASGDGGDGASRGNLNSVADPLRHLQREFFRLGWHRTGEAGVNLLAYTWTKGPKSGAKIHGVVISRPGRLLDPLPPLNVDLVPAAQS